MIPSFNVQLVNGDVNVVWTSPVIVAIRIVILDWVIYFFYLDVLLFHYDLRSDVTATATWYVMP